ncbi:hypothetical protein ACWD4J_36375 [Streptomyces sp. NPDC002577]
MLAVFGAIGASASTAVLTSILVRHPFQVATQTSAGKVVTDIPQVYADAGYTQVYLFVGGIGAVMALLLGIALRFSKAPAIDQPVPAGAADAAAASPTALA